MTEEKELKTSAGSPQVGIVMGSDSDLDIMQEAAAILKKFQIPYEMTVASAHRSPQRAAEFAGSALQRGLKVIIAGAGHAAHLAGVLAAHTHLPVIGVPIDSSCLQGLDALLATVQMPPGVPVGTMSLGTAGAKNAAVFAVQILALSDSTLAKKLSDFKQSQKQNVIEKDRKLQSE